LAGTWDFRRKPYEFRSGGNGPTAASGSRFAESRDGGRTWTDLNSDNRSGLPKQPWGRLEIAYAPSNPKQVYAFIENVRPALFASADRGRSEERPAAVQNGLFDDRFRRRREELLERCGSFARRLARRLDQPDEHEIYGGRRRRRAVDYLRWRSPLGEELEPARQPILSRQHRHEGPVPGLWRLAG